MAKIQVSQVKIKKLSLDIRKQTLKKLRSESLRQEIATIVSDGIKNNPLTLGSASDKYQKQRTRLIKKGNKPFKTFQNSKIKALFTGELFNDLADKRAVRSKQTAKNIEYAITHTKRLHKKYKGTKVKKRISYRDLSKRLYDLGYKYLYFSKGTRVKVIKAVQNALK